MIVAITAFLPMKLSPEKAWFSGTWTGHLAVFHHCSLSASVHAWVPATDFDTECAVCCGIVPSLADCEGLKGQCRWWWQRDHHKQKPQVMSRDQMCEASWWKQHCKAGRQCFRSHSLSPSPILLSPITCVCFRGSPVSLGSFSFKW